jgi:hypothetical protein
LAGQFAIRIDHIHCCLCVVSSEFVREAEIGGATADYFAATFLGQQMKLRILCEKLMIISQRVFGIPPFRFYALADGITQYDFACSGGDDPRNFEGARTD